MAQILSSFQLFFAAIKLLKELFSLLQKYKEEQQKKEDLKKEQERRKAFDDLEKVEIGEDDEDLEAIKRGNRDIVGRMP